MKIFSHLFRCVATVVLCFLCSFSVNAQVIRTAGIDSLVVRTMKAFDVPGIAVAVVQGDRIVHLKGYGVRSLNTRLVVDENTLFGIASNSKAFTTAALGILADENKLHWDDKVVDYIPEFRLYNPYVTEEFTIRDLLTHRSGLGLGAGDLMIWPGGNDFAVADIIHNLRYLKPVSGFRTKFDYDNLLYIVAGEVVARVSGMSWEVFVEERIMKPLGMNGSASAYSRIKDKSNVIDPHAPVDGVLQVIERDFTETGDAAGGIYSNISDMCKWIMMQMDRGKYGDDPGKQLFSREVHDAMWTPNTILPARGTPPYNTRFSSYGLGWFISDVKGYRQVSHTGGLGGMVTQVTLFPEKKLGIIVFTNQQSGEAFSSITNTIKDSYLGLPPTNWIKAYSTQSAGQVQQAKKISEDIWKEIEAQKMKPSGSVNDSLYTGTYTDQWFGDVTLTSSNGKMRFEAKRSPKLSGEMMYYQGNTFVVKWKDRSMDADAYVVFTLDLHGRASGMTMKAISPLTDFSYDFHDLSFTRKN